MMRSREWEEEVVSLENENTGLYNQIDELVYQYCARLADDIRQLHLRITEKFTDEECDCENPELYYHIHHGSMFNEVWANCIKCGGMVELT